MAKPFHRSSGFECFPNFDFLNSLLIWWTISKCKVCAFEWKINKYSYELEISQYSIFLLPCLVKKDTFFETPVIKVALLFYHMAVIIIIFVIWLLLATLKFITNFYNFVSQTIGFWQIVANG